jgi:hypothetical protein
MFKTRFSHNRSAWVFKTRFSQMVNRSESSSQRGRMIGRPVLRQRTVQRKVTSECSVLSYPIIVYATIFLSALRKELRRYP